MVVVLLQPLLLTIQVLELTLKLLDEFLVTGQRELGQVELLLGDLLSLLGFCKLVPKCSI